MYYQLLSGSLFFTRHVSVPFGDRVFGFQGACNNCFLALSNFERAPVLITGACGVCHEERDRVPFLNSALSGQPFLTSEKRGKRVDKDSGVICVLLLYKIKVQKELEC